jgi:hypothetical protein
MKDNTKALELKNEKDKDEKSIVKMEDDEAVQSSPEM